MNRYQALLKVLDRLRAEAPSEFKIYHPAANDLNLVMAARSRAFIHLLLKVRFGLIEFGQREDSVTEGTSDGGIDAFYVDAEHKTIYFIQSKFRQTEKNFEEKAIAPEELLMMDIDRVLKGETASEQGVPYNGKFQGMVTRIRCIEDIGRYQYRVIILANVKGVTRQKLSTLTGGFATEVVDYAKCYKELLFPLVSGTFFTADSLNLSLTLSNKNAGAKISYTVQTEHAKTEITVVVVPTLEIAKAMFKYRNAILKYNPRSFLEHEGHSVNQEIRKSIESRHTNEFALFNNGITMLSDETYLNERIGQKDRAQLTLVNVNPQIINGGQTAYTLSQIYKDNVKGDVDGIFGQKEVLVKIITFDSANRLHESQRLALIEDISRATNSQTSITKADRRSNEIELQALQSKAFERLGMFVERKRGEFGDGVREGYIDPATIVDRNTFIRSALVAIGNIHDAAKRKLAAQVDYKSILSVSDELFDDYKTALYLLQRIHRGRGRNRLDMRFESVAKTYVALQVVREHSKTQTMEANALELVANEVVDKWSEFLSFSEARYPQFTRAKKDKTFFDVQRYINGGDIKQNALDFFCPTTITVTQIGGC